MHHESMYAKPKNRQTITTTTIIVFSNKNRCEQAWNKRQRNTLNL